MAAVSDTCVHVVPGMQGRTKQEQRYAGGFGDDQELDGPSGCRWGGARWLGQRDATTGYSPAPHRTVAKASRHSEAAQPAQGSKPAATREGGRGFFTGRDRSANRRCRDVAPTATAAIPLARQRVTQPPDSGKTWPTKQLAASLHKCAANDASSSALTKRPQRDPTRDAHLEFGVRLNFAPRRWRGHVITSCADDSAGTRAILA